MWEVPISYHGRTYAEGKKIGLKDAIQALTNLGANLQKFDALPQDKKDELTARLKEEVEATGKRSRWATDSLAFLRTLFAAPDEDSRRR